MAEKITFADLDGFTGTENWHRASIFRRLLVTDGIKFLADKAGAYWLIDLVGSYMPKLSKMDRLRDFQLWRIDVKNGYATITCRGDTNEKPVVSQRTPTDFPDTLNGLEWYVEISGDANGNTFWVMLLKSEH